ncbi:MAG: hypothetical protein EHM58_05225 [Ignavibacteriae bacterium]|nr:MAG: hypothetical protein EHM58_05225 [Ignavibacteriota bacterium]
MSSSITDDYTGCLPIGIIGAIIGIIYLFGEIGWWYFPIILIGIWTFICMFLLFDDEWVAFSLITFCLIIIINIIIIALTPDFYIFKTGFWPITTLIINQYDYSEFLIYTLSTTSIVGLRLFLQHFTQ